MKNNLRETLIEALETDDGFKKDYTSTIRSKFYNKTHEKQAEIDDIFIDLCGFSLTTLLSECE